MLTTATCFVLLCRQLLSWKVRTTQEMIAWFGAMALEINCRQALFSLLPMRRKLQRKRSHRNAVIPSWTIYLKQDSHSLWTVNFCLHQLVLVCSHILVWNHDSRSVMYQEQMYTPYAVHIRWIEITLQDSYFCTNYLSQHLHCLLVGRHLWIVHMVSVMWLVMLSGYMYNIRWES